MIRVLVVDDSKTMRELIGIVLESDPGLHVIGKAGNGEEAIRLCDYLQPDVITMDIRMPLMNGYEAIQHIMAEFPCPIVVCTTTMSDKEMNISFMAIEAGALAVIGKPSGLPGEDLAADELIATVKAMADVKVIRRRRWLKKDQQPVRLSPQPGIDHAVDTQLVAIGASTGGPPAIQKILCGLGYALPVPILVVQHITPGFVVGLARWLNETTPSLVAVAQEGEYLEPGRVYLAPDSHHMEITVSNLVALKSTKAVNRHRPSITITFESVARVMADRAVGVLLTGMGEDGARGLETMIKAGAYTIAQDEASSIVFGMPKVAIELRAVTEVLPLDQIAPRLELLVQGKKSSKIRSNS